MRAAGFKRAVWTLAATLLLGVAHAADVHVMDAWSRATPPGTDVAVGYVSIHNMGRSPLKLSGASSPRAQRVEMHETRIDDKGMSTMRPLKDVVVAPGTALTFAAGGRHLMLVGLKSPLVAGEKVPLTLRFDGEPPVEVLLDVRPIGAAGPAEDHAHHAH